MARSCAGLLDLVGILTIGYLATSIALFLSKGSDPSRSISFAGVQLSTVTLNSLPQVALIILALFVSKALISILATRAMALHLAKVEARAAKHTAKAIFDNEKGASRLLAREEIMYHVQVGTAAMYTAILNHLATLVSEGFLFVLISIGFFAVNPPAALCILLYFLAIAAVIQIFIGTKLSNTSREISENSISANSAISDIYDAYRELTVAGKKNFYIDKLYNARRLSARRVGEQVYLLGMPRHLVETSLIVGVFAFGYAQSLSGDIVASATTMGVFLTGGLRMMAAMLPWQNALASIKQAVPQAQGVVGLLKTSNVENSSPREYRGAYHGAKVRFESVSFSYPSSNVRVVKDVNFEIMPGQQIGIIGASGAGKSTVAELMVGLLKPEEGNIFIDSERPSEVLSRSPGKIAFVPQKPGMVSGTVLENIALGTPPSQVNEERLFRSIRQAHLEDVIKNLPLGIHTDLGAHRDALSGGQLQRLGLARALYCNPAIIVLDEATSHLDAESEHEISSALAELHGTITVVLVAHRLHTVQNADMVLLMVDGQILDSGKLDQLKRKNPQVNRAIRLMEIKSGD